MNQSSPVIADTKTVYVKRWRTLVKLPAKYADEIVEALREPARFSADAEQAKSSLTTEPTCSSGDVVYTSPDRREGRKPVAEYVADYRFEFDGGQQYTPADHERAMLEDAIEGYLADSGEVAAWRWMATADDIRAVYDAFCVSSPDAKWMSPTACMIRAILNRYDVVPKGTRDPAQPSPLQKAVAAAHAAFEAIPIGYPLQQNGRTIDHTLLNEAKRLCEEAVAITSTESK